MNTKKISRRAFAGRTAAAATLLGFPAVARPGRILGANDRVRTAFIGVRNRGGQLIDAFQEHKDQEIVALCDIDDSVLAAAKEKVGGAVATYKDYRAMLENGAFDAVVIATPDHWHALQFIDAADAGKHVYVEKPLSITIHEGRRMVEAARRNKIVSQVGTHRRSTPGCIEATRLIRDGKIGKVTVTRAYRISNMYPNGIGRAEQAEPPSNFDWNMWLGPRPFIPYKDNYHPYKFRWHKAYSSQTGNWGVHYIDVMRWGLNVVAPKRIATIGGIYAVRDDRDIPDTMQVTFEWPNSAIGVFGQYEANSGAAHNGPGDGDVEFRGTQGNLYLATSKWVIVPGRGGQFQDNKPRMEPAEGTDNMGNAEATALHARNFLDCIRSGQACNADIEIGHRSTSCAHLGNIALQVGRVLDWDAETEQFTNCPEANDLLHYEYRAPWKLR